ncbi:hypothetical protein [Pantoea eucalypti]|uniref:hypothetical protein n=1 Tax=Pantoea eucalypti TaxID=470933 RepID=UPI002897E852|nr:hypothetical protein [Pantoea eucalypti]
MNTRLLTYIDTFLYHSSNEPLQQLVYIIAKLCLITAPVAWVVKSPGGSENKLFTSQEEALTFLEKQGHKDDYVAPLFTTVKVDMNAGEIRHLLLTPTSY